MTQLIDSEGKSIPKDDFGRILFDAMLWGSRDGQGPELSINVPMYFETDTGVYDSCGVLLAPLQFILEEYLDDFKEIDGGIGIPEFVRWLRDYANRLESSLTSFEQ